jgi:hypothetical protein
MSTREKRVARPISGRAGPVERELVLVVLLTFAGHLRDFYRLIVNHCSMCKDHHRYESARERHAHVDIEANPSELLRVLLPYAQET